MNAKFYFSVQFHVLDRSARVHLKSMNSKTIFQNILSAYHHRRSIEEKNVFVCVGNVPITSLFRHLLPI